MLRVRDEDWFERGDSPRNGHTRQHAFLHKPADFDAWPGILAEPRQQVPVRIRARCLVPNHWHLLPGPHAGPDLSCFVG